MTAPQRSGETADGHDPRVEQIIGRLLQLGVLSAAVVVLIGGIALLVQYGSDAAAFQVFHSENASLRSIAAIVTVAFHGDSRGIVQLGLLLLIATPIARVALTLVAFALQRDRLYVATTLIVLILLLYGLIWGRA
ncbi:MAG TPA: DUF1634 domain-containing protein [Gemmatimonadaceae bacterium]|nr:DUF1634 domain-containing protein [Gemmatimonadaceae bacterium]